MKALFFPVVILCSIVSFGQDAGARKKNFNLSDGVGIKGYDPVAYFSQHKAIKGSKDLAVSFAGVGLYYSDADLRARLCDWLPGWPTDLVGIVMQYNPAGEDVSF